MQARTVRKPLRTATKGETVYSDVKVAILSGRFKPGQLISANRLAKEFGVARSVVCESLARLRAEGLVRNEGPYARTYVEQPELPAVVEHYEVREVVEGAAARLAAQNMNAWQVAELRRLAERVLSNPPESKEFMDANVAFHHYLVANCGNALLLRIYQTNHLAPVAVSTYSNRAAKVDHTSPESNDSFFRMLCDAIAARDGQAAESSIRKDLRQVTEELRAMASAAQL
jgi:DNA-binding GntR family transcriptional regulator